MVVVDYSSIRLRGLSLRTRLLFLGGVEHEMDDVSVLDDVGLALDAVLARRLDGSKALLARGVLHEVVEGDALRLPSLGRRHNHHREDALFETSVARAREKKLRHAEQPAP